MFIIYIIYCVSHAHPWCAVLFFTSSFIIQPETITRSILALSLARPVMCVDTQQMVLMLHRTCDGFFLLSFLEFRVYFISHRRQEREKERVRRKVNVLTREMKGSALLITATHMNVPVNSFPGSFRRLRENFLCSSVDEKKICWNFFFFTLWFLWGSAIV